MKKILLLAFLIVSAGVFGQSAVQVFRPGQIDAYSKSELQTSGRANIDWGNLKNVPDTVMLMIDSTVMLNVRDFGAVGDGVTDDYNAFNTAMQFAYDYNKILYIPNDTFKINTGIYITDTDTSTKNNLSIVSDGGFLDFSGVSGAGTTYAFYVLGQLSDAIDIMYPISEGDTIIYADSYVKENSVIVLYNDLEYYGGIGRLGEILKVKRMLNDTTIVVYDMIYHNYDFGWIKRYYDGAVSLKNIKIKMNKTEDSGFGIIIDNISSANITDVEIFNGTEMVIDLSKSYGSKITNCTVYGGTKNGAGYGIGSYGNKNITISDNHIYDCRHAITAGGPYPSVNVLIDANIVSTAHPYDGAIDTHSPTKYVTVSNNILTGGSIWMAGKNIKITDNTIMMNRGGGGIQIDVYGDSLMHDYFLVSNNVVSGIKNFNENLIGIRVRFRANCDTINSLKISDNIFNSYGSASTSSGIYVTTESSGNIYNHIKNLCIEDNIVNHNSTNSYSVYFSNYISYDNIIFKNNIVSSAKYGIGIASGTVESNNIEVSGNSIKSLSNPFEMSTTPRFLSASIHDNKFELASATNTPLVLSADRIDFYYNTVKNITLNGGLKMYSDYAVQENNRFINTSGDIYYSGSAVKNGFIHSGTDTLTFIKNLENVITFSGVLEANGTNGDSLKITCVLKSAYSRTSKTLCQSSVKVRITNHYVDNGHRQSVTETFAHMWMTSSSLKAVEVINTQISNTFNVTTTAPYPDITDKDEATSTEFSFYVTNKATYQNWITIQVLDAYNVNQIVLTKE